jgi:small basic protein (TIGR04137 family)
MSQHSSLRIDKVGTRHRNVLKRYERIEKLKKVERWQDGDSVLGLPKVKSQKIKAKKSKGEPEKAAGEAAAGAAGAAKAPAKK